MNSIHHHPEDASLAAYAAGSLPAALALVVGCHLEYCARCRQIVAEAESIGGSLLNEMPASKPNESARAAILAMLDDEDSPSSSPSSSPVAAQAPAPAASEANKDLPRKLQNLLGERDLHKQAWKSAGPGVRILRLNAGEGNAILLDIAPNHSVPVHTHKNTELTLILNGHYDDSLGRFAVGDVADLDDQTEHQPKAGPSGCLCLAGLDGPLRYRDLLPRLLQPFFPL